MYTLAILKNPLRHYTKWNISEKGKYSWSQSYVESKEPNLYKERIEWWFPWNGGLGNVDQRGHTSRYK